RQRQRRRHRRPARGPPAGDRDPVLPRARPVRRLRAHDGHPARPPRRPLRGRRGAPDMRGAQVSRALAGAAPWLAALLALAILPLAFSMILYSLLLRLYSLTGGTDGMVTAPPTILGFSPGAAAGRAHYYLTLSCLALALALTRRWLGSPLGYLASAIRDNEIRVEYMGASVRQGIYRTYLLSGVLGGLGGCLVAFTVGHIAPA